MNKSKILRRGFASKFYAYRNLVQVIPTGVWTTVILDTEQYDILAEFDSVALYRFVPNEIGYYFCYAHARFGLLPVGTVSQLRMSLTGATISQMSAVNDNVFDFRLHALYFDYLTPNMRIDIEVRQNSGVNQNLIGGNDSTYLSGFRVG